MHMTLLARPLKTLLNNIQDGQMNDKQLLTAFVNGVNESGAEIMNPFISESIWTEAVTDLTVRGGVTADGRRLYTDQTSAGDKAAIRFLHLGNALAPSYKQFVRLVQASDRYTNKDWTRIRFRSRDFRIYGTTSYQSRS